MASHTGKIDMIRGSIIKSAALFALPICVGNILQQLYGTVDTLVVGNFCDSAALAAVGTATQPMEILLCVFLGIGNGASILVSQEMGRRNADGLRMLVRTTVWFLYLCAIPVTILAMFVGPALLRLMQVPADAFDYAVLYLRITALGTLGNLGYNMNAGILRGLGDSRSTLLLLLISCLTNIVLDVAFVAVLGMGVAGAALATTIALYLSWLASILYARRNYEGLQFPLLPHGCDKAQLAAILKVGVPLGLNNSLYSVGHVAVQAVYNMQGSVFVAGCSIAGRVTGIAGIAITSFSSAAVVFAGQNLGAGNYRRLQRGVVQITCAAGVVTLLIGLVATVFCRPLLGLFSSDPAVLDALYLVGAAFYLDLCGVQLYDELCERYRRGQIYHGGQPAYPVGRAHPGGVYPPCAGVRHFLHGLRFPQLCRGPGGHARLFFDPGMGQTAPQGKGTGGRGDGGNRTDTNIKSIKVCGELPK